MSLWLKQSTAVTVKIGPFVDDTDFKTAETALTISQADIRLSKNGGAFAQSNNAAGATHDASGYYGVPLDATDTNTLGTLRVFVAETGALQVWQDFMVAPANVWDSLFGADLLQVDSTQLLGTAYATPSVAGIQEVDVTHFNGTAGTFAAGRPEVNTTHAAGTAWNSGAIGAATLAADTITAAKIAADAIGASELAADAVAEIADAVWDEDATAHQTQGTFGQAIGDPAADTNTIYKAVVTDATGATVGVDVVTVKAETASIQADTNDLQTQVGTAGAGLTNINLPNQTMDIVGNITGNLSGSVGSVTGAVGSVTGLTPATVHADLDDIQARIPAALVSGRIDASVGAMAANVMTASALAADAVTEINSVVSGTADSGSTTTMVDAARTEADTDYWKDMMILFTSGTIAGQARLITAFTPGTDTITFTPATTQAVGTNTYEIIRNVAAAGASAPTAAEVADAVWDEDATAHQTQGTFGQAIGDPVADTNTIFKAVVSDATGATVGVDVVAVKAETALIQTDTNDLQIQIGTAGAGLTNIDLPDQTMNITGNITGNLSGSVGSVTGLTAANLDTTVSSRATPAQILTTALTESYAADGAAGTLTQILYFIQQILSEASVTATTMTVNKLDGVTAAATLTLNDGTNPTSITRAT